MYYYPVVDVVWGNFNWNRVGWYVSTGRSLVAAIPSSKTCDPITLVHVVELTDPHVVALTIVGKVRVPLFVYWFGSIFKWDALSTVGGAPD